MRCHDDDDVELGRGHVGARKAEKREKIFITSIIAVNQHWSVGFKCASNNRAYTSSELKDGIREWT